MVSAHGREPSLLSVKRGLTEAASTNVQDGSSGSKKFHDERQNQVSMEFTLFLKQKVEKFNIPLPFLVNVDQTPLKMVHVGRTTLAAVKTKRQRGEKRRTFFFVTHFLEELSEWSHPSGSRQARSA